MVTARRLSRGRAVVVAVLGILVAFYAWTALTSADPSLGNHGRTDPYNRQASAFLHGQLSLRIKPPRSLTSLADPYDPRQSLPVIPGDLHDLTLYKGRLYTYWGPVPAIVAFAPFRILGFGDLPPALALLGFALLALAAQAALLALLQARYLAAAPRWMLLVGIAVVALADVMPFMLRTPESYEVAIGSGAAFVSLGLYLLAAGALRERLHLGRLAGGSLAMGLALGSRPPMGIAIAFVLPILWIHRRDPRLVRLGLALLAPFAACVAASAAYNWARFGAPSEFGLKYTLTGFDIHDGKLGHLSFLRPGLFYYLLEPLRPRAAFPFLWLGPPPFFPGSVPSAYEAPERVAGVLWSVPLLLMLLSVPFTLRGAGRRALGGLVAGAVAVGGALTLFIAAYQPVATQRYEVDFLVLLLPAAVLAWMALAARAGEAGRARLRRVVLLVGTVLGAWAAVVGVSTSLVGYDDSLRLHHRGSWNAISGAFSPVERGIARVAGRPLVAAVGHDPVDAKPWGVARLDLDGATFRLGYLGGTVQVISPKAMDAVLRARVTAIGKVRAVQVSAHGAQARARLRGATDIVLRVRLHGGRNTLLLRPLTGAPYTFGTGLAVGGLRLREAP